ncbi:MAG TPA: ATP-binding protein [Thermoanaerobaculia bacterium]
MKRPLSIRARLFLLLSMATALFWIFAVSMSYADARRELGELFDAQLAESAEVLLRQAAHDLDEDERDERPEKPFEHAIDHPYARQLHFQIWDRSGRLAYQSSPDLPRTPIVTGTTTGYADRTLHGVRWRIAVLTDPESGLQIQLCQRYDAREGVAAAIARNMFLPLAAALPLLAALVWMATARGLRPLGRFTTDISERSPDNLRPVGSDGLPAELQPVAGALDGLLERLRMRIDHERRFTADAAHELRTPLAALKTHAQVALGARTDEERTRALTQIVRGTDRMTHLVAQLLTLARVDPEMAEPHDPVDLGSVVREAAGALAPMARERGVELEVDASEALVPGNRALLVTLARNLVENAILYVRKGDRVRAIVEADARAVVLRVVDDGPGIPAEERARAFERFHRVPGTREEGSGLGLSIVERIALQHGASVVLDEPAGGGLEVELRFRAHRGT